MKKNIYKKHSAKIDTNARSRLDTETVLHTISGDPVALMQIVEIYEPYILADKCQTPSHNLPFCIVR